MKAVSSLVSDGYAHLPPSQREELAVALHAFLQGVRHEDLVVALAEEQLLIGTVDEVSPNDEPSPPLLSRPVVWSESRTPLEALPAKLSAEHWSRRATSSTSRR